MFLHLLEVKVNISMKGNLRGPLEGKGLYPALSTLLWLDEQCQSLHLVGWMWRPQLQALVASDLFSSTDDWDLQILFKSEIFDNPKLEWTLQIKVMTVGSVYVIEDMTQTSLNNKESL